jgi:hypothetical protein
LALRVFFVSYGFTEYQHIPHKCWYFFGGTWEVPLPRYQQQGLIVALTDTLVTNVKPGGSAAGGKHADGQGLYLHVKEAGKYWLPERRLGGRSAEGRTAHAARIKSA